MEGKEEEEEGGRGRRRWRERGNLIRRWKKKGIKNRSSSILLWVPRIIR